MRALTNFESLRHASSLPWIKAYAWASFVHQNHDIDRLFTCAAAAFAFMHDGGTLDSTFEDLSQWAKAYPLDVPVVIKPLFAKKGASHAHA